MTAGQADSWVSLTESDGPKLVGFRMTSSRIVPIHNYSVWARGRRTETTFCSQFLNVFLCQSSGELHDVPGPPRLLPDKAPVTTRTEPPSVVVDVVTRDRSARPDSYNTQRPEQHGHNAEGIAGPRATLSRPVPCRAEPCYAMPRRVVPCHAVPCRDKPCRSVTCCAVP